MTQSVVVGSLADVSKQSGQSVAISFLSADVICLVDVSGSMIAGDAPGGRRRFDVMCEELTKVQKANPGKVAVVAFSFDVQFVPGGVPPFLASSTNLSDGLRFVKPADGTVKFIVISDGVPDDPEGAIAIARTFESRIDTIYVGPEGDTEGGRAFLNRLASVAGGRYVESLKTAGLGEDITKLLRAG